VTTALIAGRGGLPLALVAAMEERPLIAALEGFAPAGLAPDLTFRIERLVPFLDALEDRGVTRVIFAGAVARPRLDPALLDPGTATLLPRLMAAMAQGDDATLRVVLELFTEAGFTIAGVAEVAPGLIPAAGLLAGAVTVADKADATRAAAIVAALGSVDVGQGAVVQQGLCLAVEALPGTDAMLGVVASLPADLRPDAARGKGVFYKAPKPGQDRRIDLPTLGLDTVRLAAAAGLGGLVWQAEGVICLDPAAMVAEADRLGLFLWSRDP
jgi:UDP-2,3-diacylglucosamine hydrolase